LSSSVSQQVKEALLPLAIVLDNIETPNTKFLEMIVYKQLCAYDHSYRSRVEPFEKKVFLHEGLENNEFIESVMKLYRESTTNEEKERAKQILRESSTDEANSKRMRLQVPTLTNLSDITRQVLEQHTTVSLQYIYEKLCPLHELINDTYVENTNEMFALFQDRPLDKQVSEVQALLAQTELSNVTRLEMVQLAALAHHVVSIFNQMEEGIIPNYKDNEKLYQASVLEQELGTKLVVLYNNQPIDLQTFAGPLCVQLANVHKLFKIASQFIRFPSPIFLLLHAEFLYEYIRDHKYSSTKWTVPLCVALRYHVSNLQTEEFEYDITWDDDFGDNMEDVQHSPVQASKVRFREPIVEDRDDLQQETVDRVLISKPLECSTSLTQGPSIQRPSAALKSNSKSQRYEQYEPSIQILTPPDALPFGQVLKPVSSPKRVVMPTNVQRMTPPNTPPRRINMNLFSTTPPRVDVPPRLTLPVTPPRNNDPSTVTPPRNDPPTVTSLPFTPPRRNSPPRNNDLRNSPSAVTPPHNNPSEFTPPRNSPPRNNDLRNNSSTVTPPRNNSVSTISSAPPRNNQSGPVLTTPPRNGPVLRPAQVQNQGSGTAPRTITVQPGLVSPRRVVTPPRIPVTTKQHNSKKQ
jgi:hypothetical protein